MIFWRIEFNGDRHGETGYQVMDANLNFIGVYDDDGNKVTGAIDYHTTDSGADPTVGVTPPSWAGSINA